MRWCGWWVALVVSTACGGRTTDVHDANVAGSSSGGIDGAGARGGDGGFGAAGSPGEAGSAGEAVTPSLACPRVDEVSPSESATWTWRRCGELPPDPDPPFEDIPNPFPVDSVSLSGDGRWLAATIEYSVYLWHQAEGASGFEFARRLGRGESRWAEISRDGARLLAMGEATDVFDIRTGVRLPFVDPLEENTSMQSTTWCRGTEERLSPDGSLMAGKNFGTKLWIYETAGFTRVAEIETHHCDQGIAFSGDGRWLFTPSAAIDTKTFEPTPDSNLKASKFDFVMRFLISTCDGETLIHTECASTGGCTTDVAGTVLSGGAHASLSPEEHWLVSGNQLLHRPSGKQLVLDGPIAEATFAPNGDLFVGETDRTVARYCRSDH